ncbi:hypothetical protein [Halomonas sp.]|uniref:hypothetical protein n=1 Tax=Halomonas sp. TaxID=1486246 RepID=UPI0035671AB2
MKRLAALLIFGLTLIVVFGGLDVQQMHSAHAQVEDALDGRPMSACTRQSPCVIPSVEADVCTLLTTGESFLGRSSGFDAVFEASAPCQRRGHYRITFHARAGES